MLRHCRIAENNSRSRSGWPEVIGTSAMNFESKRFLNLNCPRFGLWTVPSKLQLPKQVRKQLALGGGGVGNEGFPDVDLDMDLVIELPLVVGPAAVDLVAWENQSAETGYWSMVPFSTSCHIHRRNTQWLSKLLWSWTLRSSSTISCTVNYPTN